MKRLFVAAAIAAGTLFPVAALADTVPNLVALATPDMKVAVTVAAYPNRVTLADAGAFASLMTQQFGMVGIPNYDPQTNADSVLVCDIAYPNSEFMAIYGIRGQGTDEATNLCQYFSDTGVTVRWD